MGIDWAGGAAAVIASLVVGAVAFGRSYLADLRDSRDDEETTP